MSFFSLLVHPVKNIKGTVFFHYRATIKFSQKGYSLFFFFLNTSSYPSIWLCVYNSLFHLYKVVAAAQVSLQETS